jgi:hypothetical protein
MILLVPQKLRAYIILESNRDRRQNESKCSLQQGRTSMADRKPILGDSPPRPELDGLFEEARRMGVSDADLAEQRISFAYGNAPENSGITKESVREASRSMRLIIRR